METHRQPGDSAVAVPPPLTPHRRGNRMLLGDRCWRNMSWQEKVDGDLFLEKKNYVFGQYEDRKVLLEASITCQCTEEVSKNNHK